MRIDNIDYFIMLMVGEWDNDDTKSYYFSDFDEFNKFVEENRVNDELAQGPYSYSFVENIDGEPAGFSWTQEIEFETFTKEKIDAEIDYYREYLIEISEWSKNFDEYSTEMHYTGEAEDYKEKQYHLNDIVYVCPNCFREVEDCRCRFYPYYLVQVDRKILPIIRELNKKGYITTGCCAGHPKDGDIKSANIHICFDQEYNFGQDLPEGATWSKVKHSINFKPISDKYEDLVEFQKKTLWALEDWVDMLFEIEAL